MDRRIRHQRQRAHFTGSAGHDAGPRNYCRAAGHRATRRNRRSPSPRQRTSRRSARRRDRCTRAKFPDGAHSRAARTARAPDAPHSMNAFPTGRVLVVDDTPANVSLLLDALSDAGHEILVAEGGRSALSLLEHTTPDLVLMDFVMPGMDGVATCRRL